MVRYEHRVKQYVARVRLQSEDVDRVKCEADLIDGSHGITLGLKAVPITLHHQTVIPVDFYDFIKG